MGEVFVSYQSKDRERVRVLVDALRAEGLAIWWDQDIPANGVWASEIEAALAHARAVVVCWSKAAVASENVREEARRARARGLLVQAYIEECEPPLFFGEQQGAQLAGWSGAREHDRFKLLVEGLRAVLGGKPLPKRLQKEIGYKQKQPLALPALIVAGGVALAAGAAVLWLPEVRERIFPPPPVTWAMTAGGSADLRPARPPEASFMERVSSATLIALVPTFTPDREPREAMTVSDVKLELLLPGRETQRFSWLWFTDNDDDPADYIDRTGAAGPFAMDAAGSREITFQPVDAYPWSSFVTALAEVFGAGEKYFSLRLTASITRAGEETQTVSAECRLPVAPVLERIQREGRTGEPLDWVAAPCGAEAPDLPPPAPAAVNGQ